jgi:Lrp/AsnC family transcriptional regulator for asnA, asnC and gidA
MKIDKLDKQILEYLVKDARKPFTEIAKDLLVSPGTIHVRVKKMESLGIIMSTSISVDYV